MENLLEQIRENAGYWNDNKSRCDNQTMVVIESIAICFQALIDHIDKNTIALITELDELKIEIDKDPRDPAFR